MTNFKRPNLFNYLFKRESPLTDTSENSSVSIVESMLSEYYTSFVKNHPDLILILSVDGQILSYSQRRMTEVLGYHLKQKIDYKDKIPKEQYLLLTSAFNTAKNGKSKRIHFNILHKNDELLDMIGTFIPIKTSNKRVEAIALIVKNITEQKNLERENKLKQSHLEQVQEIANIGSWAYDIAKDQLSCSESCYDIVGLKPSHKPTKELLLSMVHLEDRNHLIQLLKRAISKGESFVTKLRINHARTKQIRYIKLKVEVELEEKRSIKLVGVLKDFTAQKDLETELLEVNKAYRHIFDHLKAGFWMWDVSQKKLIFASQGLSDILQMPIETLYETSNFWKDMIVKEYRDDFNQKNKLLDKGEPIEQIYQIEAGDGTIKWIHEQTIPKVDESGNITHLFGRILDISHEIKMKQKLEFLAKYDEITSLPNRYSLHDKIDELIADEQIKNFSLFYIDLDNFHWVVNHLGHQIGDRVLQTIANRLINLRLENSFLAKKNSDEFVLIISNYEDRDRIYKIADQLIQHISQLVKIDDYEFHVTASIGVSFYPDNGERQLILLENAHTALHHAKSLGKNNYQIYSTDRDISAHKRYILERDLRKALEQKQFEVYYQPQVNPRTQTIVGAEALIRWNHPEWGLVSPAEFIPIAEKKHLIGKIDDWVIDNVCWQLHAWREQGYSLFPISINVSPIRFLKPGIVDTIKEALNTYDIPAKYIVLEVTEGSLLQNEEYILNTLQEIKELGVKIALDDFGTGYSNFQYLQILDVDIIKIDQSFIRNIFYDGKSDTKEAAIVSSFLHLAHELNMEVVAEGVEELEQLEFLTQKQCEVIQGYIFSKPVPAQDFEKLIQRRYLNPQIKKRVILPEKERRKYFRFQLPYHLPAKMFITEINKRKVNVGYATILIENISLGGIRFLSTLRLPVVSNLRLHYEFELMGEAFNIDGSLVYKNDERADIYSYGVAFNIGDSDKDQLASVINQMTVLSKHNQNIPDTTFVEGDPYLFLRKSSL